MHLATVGGGVAQKSAGNKSSGRLQVAACGLCALIEADVKGEVGMHWWEKGGAFPPGSSMYFLCAFQFQLCEQGFACSS